MTGDRADFLRAVAAARSAIRNLAAHPLAEPGFKGLIAELLMLAEVDEAEVIRAEHPGWPSPDAMEAVQAAALQHLRRLVAKGWIQRATYGVADDWCFYCHAVVKDGVAEDDVPHKLDCPYIAAIAFLDGLTSNPPA